MVRKGRVRGVSSRRLLSLIVFLFLHGLYCVESKRYRRNTETTNTKEEIDGNAFEWLVARARNTRNRFETLDFQKLFPGKFIHFDRESLYSIHPHTMTIQIF